MHVCPHILCCRQSLFTALADVDSEEGNKIECIHYVFEINEENKRSFFSNVLILKAKFMFRNDKLCITSWQCKFILQLAGIGTD